MHTPSSVSNGVLEVQAMTAVELNAMAVPPASNPLQPAPEGAEETS